MTYKGHADQRWGPTTYAQHGDDLMALNLFELIGGEHAKRYLDLGAHHPTDISNTRLLYERGWRGVNVEANPDLIPAFLKERPEDTTVCVGVAAEPGEADFYRYSQTSGRNTFSRAETESLKGVMTVQAVEPLKVVSVNQIVKTYCGGVWPAFLSVDIEGLDHEVIASADFSESSPLVICVETRRHETVAREELLLRKGYGCYCRMGENLFFVRMGHFHKCY